MAECMCQDGSDAERDICPFHSSLATCSSCGAQVDSLAVFPGGICVECYAKSPEGNRPLTADEIVSMWGGHVRKL